MIPVELAAVLQLDPSDRATWIAHFLDERRSVLPSDAVAGVAFPALYHDQTPTDYLAEAYRLCEHDEGQRDWLRTAVLHLIHTECEHHKVSRPNDVLGRLLELARDCGFTEIIGDKLWGWISADAYSDATCWDGRQTISLRQLTWSTLLTWDFKPEWLEKLVRDVERPDCSALCFRKLAQSDPIKALTHLPRILSLKPAYWRTLVHELINTMGVEAVLASSVLDAWQSCLSQIGRDDHLRYLLLPEGFAENDEDRTLGTNLWRALDEVGIRLERRGDTIRLRKKGSTTLLDVPLILPDPDADAQARAERMNEDFQKSDEELYQTYVLLRDLYQ